MGKHQSATGWSDRSYWLRGITQLELMVYLGTLGLSAPILYSTTQRVFGTRTLVQGFADESRKLALAKYILSSPLCDASMANQRGRNNDEIIIRYVPPGGGNAMTVLQGTVPNVRTGTPTASGPVSNVRIVNREGLGPGRWKAEIEIRFAQKRNAMEQLLPAVVERIPIVIEVDAADIILNCGGSNVAGGGGNLEEDICNENNGVWTPGNPGTCDLTPAIKERLGIAPNAPFQAMQKRMLKTVGSCPTSGTNTRRVFGGFDAQGNRVCLAYGRRNSGGNCNPLNCVRPSNRGANFCVAQVPIGLPYDHFSGIVAGNGQCVYQYRTTVCYYPPNFPTAPICP